MIAMNAEPHWSQVVIILYYDTTMMELQVGQPATLEIVDVEARGDWWPEQNMVNRIFHCTRRRNSKELDGGRIENWP